MFKNIVKFLSGFWILCATAGINFSHAQECTGDVPTFNIDLTGEPNGFFETPPTVRDGNCCGTTNPDNCIRFIVTLDPDAVGINFQITGGAIPPGALFYQIDCGPQQTVGEFICIQGQGPHVLTFCKPGNNANVFTVSSIPAPLWPDPHDVREGCLTEEVLGLTPETITWNSVSPGSPGEYNNLLSCTEGCTAPVFQPSGDVPPTIQYLVCGFPIADECGFTENVCDTVTLHVVDELLVDINPDPATFCPESPGVNVTATAAGGSSPYTYEWLNPSNTAVSNTNEYFASVAGNYTLIVQDNIAARCGALETTVNVSVANIALQFEKTDVSCFGGNDGAITLNISGGAGPYDIEWTPGNLAGSTIDNLSAGTYQVVVTDQNGCSSGGSVTINQPDGLTVSLSSPLNGSNNLACFGNQNAVISSTVSGGTAPYSYLWDGGQTSENLSGAGAGTYSLTVTDANGCAQSANITLTQPEPISVIFTPSIYNGFNISCAGGDDGFVTASAQGGTPPYNYVWNDPGNQTGPNANGLTAGTYAVTVTDANNCTAIVDVTLTEPSALTLQILAAQNVLCHGEATGSATAQANGGSGGYVYSWNTIPVQSAATANNLTAGTYTVTASDNNQCSVQTTVEIVQPEEPLSVSISKVNVSCFAGNSGSATAIVSGGTGNYSYSWNTVPAQTTETINNLTAGNYTLQVTDENNCLVQTTVNISQPAAPLTINPVQVIDVACFGNSTGSATVSASGGTPGYNYQWNTNPVQTGPSAINLAAGNYTVTAIDANGCETSLEIEISQPENGLTVSAENITDVACFGESSGAVTVQASGGTGTYSYQWNTNPPTSGNILSGVPAGNYTVTVSDQSSCTAQLSVSVNEPEAPLQASITNIQQVLCFGSATGSATVEVAGGTPGYTYLWNDPLAQTTSTATNLPAGTYSVLVTDQNGCTGTVSAQITQPATPLGAQLLSQNNVLCFGANTGSATVVGTGGSGAYSYLWSPGNATTSSVSGLIAGQYTVQVLDNNGCSSPQQIIIDITQPDEALNFNLTPSLYEGGWNVACNGDNSGSIALEPGGGTAPYTYTWFEANSDTSFTQNLNGVIAGEYAVIVTDANECTLEQSIVLTEPEPLDFTFEMTPSLCFGSNEGELKIELFGGTPDYTISWTGPDGFTSSDDELFNLFGGIYELTVTDANGCVLYSPVTVTQPEDLVIESDQISVYPGGWNVSCHDATDGSVSILPSGGTPEYNFIWQGPGNPFFSTEQNVSGLGEGTYEVVLIDDNGCIENLFIDIVAPDSISISLNAFQFPGGAELSCVGASDGSITSVVSGGTTEYAYNWSGPPGFPGAITENLENLAEGTYVLQITDNNGCINQAAVRIDPPDSLILSVTSPVFFGGNNISCFNAGDGSIELNVSGGVPGYAFSWTGPQNFSSTDQNLNDLAAGEYCVTVTDLNGCQELICITLTEPAPLNPEFEIGEFAGGWNIDCNGNNTGSISLSLTGGTSPYFYFWDGPGFFSSNNASISNLEAGTYCLSLFDGNSCAFDTCIVISQPDPLLIAATSTDFNGWQISCDGETDGAINATITGGTEEYSLEWSGPDGFTSSESAINGLTEGNYCLSVSDENNCSVTSCIGLDAPEALEISLNPITYAGGLEIDCAGNSSGEISSVISGGTPPYSFNWTGPGGYSAQTPSVGNLVSGEYCLTVTDLNGCSTTQCITLSEPEILTASPEILPVACNSQATGSIALNLSGGTKPYNVVWSNGENEPSIAGLEAGVYSVVVTDANNCTYENSFEILQPENLIINLDAADFEGNYQIDCAGNFTGSISATLFGGTPPYQFNWTGPNEFTSTLPGLENLESGTYCVTVIDANDCSASSCIDLTEPVLLNVNINPVSELLCFGDETAILTAQITGGTSPYITLWQGPDGYSSGTPTITDLAAGEYCVTITDANGCVASDCFQISEPELLQLSMSSTTYNGGFNITCFQGADGQISTGVNGGTAPYSYSWNGPAGFESDNSVLQDLIAGEYCLTVTDANNCAVQDCITLSQPGQLSSVSVVTEYPGNFNITCQGACDGEIFTAITGGTPPYDILWQGPFSFQSNQADISNLCAGTYFLTITDANGCINSLEVLLTEPDELLQTEIITSLFPSGTNISCWQAEDGSIDLNITGGIEPYDISWTGPNGFASGDTVLMNLGPGSYELIVTDANDCPSTANINLIEPDTALAMNLIADSVTCHSGSDATVFSSATGGSFPYEFNWSGPDGFESQFDFIENVIAGSYSLLLTDANGCQTSGEINVFEPEAITFESEITPPTCEAADGEILLTLSGGTGELTTEWNTGESGTDLSGIPSGSYAALITDENGCSVEADFIIEEINPLEIEVNVTDLLCYGDSTGEIGVELLNATAPVVYNWEGPEGFTSENPFITGAQGGNYLLTITDANNCIQTQEININEPDSLFLDDLFSPFPLPGLDYNISSPGGSDGSILAPVFSGGTGEVTILWSGPGGFETTDQGGQNGLISGLYTVTITDENGCSATTSITLTEPLELDLPNGISPNGDGQNDHLIIRGLERFPENELVIFNRWGNIVFTENNYSNSTPWTGISQNGSELPEGTYFVLLKVSGDLNKEFNAYLELRR